MSDETNLFEIASSFFFLFRWIFSVQLRKPVFFSFWKGITFISVVVPMKSHQRMAKKSWSNRAKNKLWQIEMKRYPNNRQKMYLLLTSFRWRKFVHARPSWIHKLAPIFRLKWIHSCFNDANQTVCRFECHCWVFFVSHLLKCQTIKLHLRKRNNCWQFKIFQIEQDEEKKSSMLHTWAIK